MNGRCEYGVGDRVRVRMNTWHGEKEVVGVVDWRVPDWRKTEGGEKSLMVGYRDGDGREWTVGLGGGKVRGGEGCLEKGHYCVKNVRVGDEVNCDGHWVKVTKVGRTLCGCGKRFKIKTEDGTVLKRKSNDRVCVRW
jgi:hypothetical protein